MDLQFSIHNSFAFSGNESPSYPRFMSPIWRKMEVFCNFPSGYAAAGACARRKVRVPRRRSQSVPIRRAPVAAADGPSASPPLSSPPSHLRRVPMAALTLCRLAIRAFSVLLILFLGRRNREQEAPVVVPSHFQAGMISRPQCSISGFSEMFCKKGDSTESVASDSIITGSKA